MIFVLWILFAFVVGFIGSGRKIGFGGAFFLSLLLSPLIGGIITLASQSKEEADTQTQIAEEAQKQTAALEAIQAGKDGVADQLQKLADMKEAGTITEEEYQAAKTKILT